MDIVTYILAKKYADNLSLGNDSVSQQIANTVNSIMQGAPADFDSFKDVADWAAAHQQEYNELEQTVLNLTIPTKLSELENDLNLSNNYENLTNLPFINNIKVVGNMSLNDLGIQEKGNYLTNEDLPTGMTDEEIEQIWTNVMV